MNTARITFDGTELSALLYALRTQVTNLNVQLHSTHSDNVAQIKYLTQELEQAKALEAKLEARREKEHKKIMKGLSVVLKDLK